MSPPWLHHRLNQMAHALRGGRRRVASHDRHRSRLVVEALEARCVPSTVTNLMDRGPGSLRQALLDTPAGGTVDFQPGLTGTITLTSGQLAIGTDLTIAGPGADLLTISGNHTSSVLAVGSRAHAAISGLTIADGSTAGIGGGINNAGTLVLSDSVVAANYSISNGAGIVNGGTLYVTGSTIRDNYTEVRLGAGIFNTGTVVIDNSTISGNGHGGAIENQGSLTITNSTVSANTDGIDDTVQLTLGNTIVAGNSGGDRGDLSGPITSLGYNLIGNGSSSRGFTTTDLVGTSQTPIDPLLGALQANGGPTPTMALLPGSPALNAGDPDALGGADQRGVVRSGGVNIGAYQASATAFLVSAPAKVRAGAPFDVTVTAVDPFGQVAAGYTGTVTFGTTDPDPGVVLPADYTFTPDDGGVHTFTDTGLGETTLITHGHQTLTVTDTSDTSVLGSATVKVKRARPSESMSGTPSPSQAGVAGDAFFAPFGPADGVVPLAGVGDMVNGC